TCRCLRSPVPGMSPRAVLRQLPQMVVRVMLCPTATARKSRPYRGIWRAELGILRRQSQGTKGFLSRVYRQEGFVNLRGIVEVIRYELSKLSPLASARPGTNV